MRAAKVSRTRMESVRSREGSGVGCVGDKVSGRGREDKTEFVRRVD